MTCRLLRAAEMESGPSGERSFGPPQIFRRFCADFLCDCGTPIFKAPKRRRKVCGKSAPKSAQVHCTPNSEKCEHKSCAKSAQRTCTKISAPKSAQKSYQESVRKCCLSEDESQKKTQNNLHQILCKTSDPKCVHFDESKPSIS